MSTTIQDDGYDIGWCSSCDLIDEVGLRDRNARWCCTKCGDYLIFADEDEDDGTLYDSTIGAR